MLSVCQTDNFFTLRGSVRAKERVTGFSTVQCASSSLQIHMYNFHDTQTKHVCIHAIAICMY